MAITTELAPDPLYGDDVEVKQIRSGVRLEGRPVLRDLVVSPDRVYCNHNDPGSAWVCTRPAGHPDHWKHVASSGASILSLWGGKNITPELVDPEDGTPADPPDLKVDTPVVGKVYRLRDRKNKLQVIGGTEDSIVRRDGLIEVLDLTKRQFRAVPQSELVPTDYYMTLDDMAFVVEYTAKVRRTVYDEGVKHYHAGRWCEAGLQDALRDQGLPRYEPQQIGVITIKIPYSAPTDLSTRTVKTESRKLIDLDAIKALVYPANDYDLEIRTGEADIKIEGVTRR